MILSFSSCNDKRERARTRKILRAISRRKTISYKKKILAVSHEDFRRPKQDLGRFDGSLRVPQAFSDSFKGMLDVLCYRLK